MAENILSVLTTMNPAQLRTQKLKEVVRSRKKRDSQLGTATKRNKFLTDVTDMHLSV